MRPDSDQADTAATPRRRLLQGLGGAALAGLAGCAGDGDQGPAGNDTAGPTGTASPATTAADGDVINVGVPVPLSGDLAFFGENIVPAVRYVVDQVNEEGGIDGRELNPVVADTEVDPDTAVSLAQKLINVDDVYGIVGYTANTLFKVLDRIQENRVPYFPATSSGDLVPEGGEYVFMVYPSDLLAGAALGLTAANGEHNGMQSFDRMGVLQAQEGLYSSFVDSMEGTYTNAGGTITETVTFAGGKSSYQSEAQRVVDSDPDIITVLASPTDASKLMRAAFNAGYSGQWLGTEDVSTPEFLESTPEQLTDGMLAIRSSSPEYVDDSTLDELSQQLQEYEEREYGIGAWLAHDATTVLALAMKKLELNDEEITRENIAANVRGIGNPPGETVQDYRSGVEVLADGGEVDFQGVRSNCNFTERGNVVSPYNVLQVSGQEWQVVNQIPADSLDY